MILFMKNLFIRLHLKTTFIWGGTLLASMVMSGCSSLLSVNVTRFHEVTTLEQKAAFSGDQKRYQFVDDVEKTNDLEKKQYAKLVAAELQRLGFSLDKKALFQLDFKVTAPKSIMQTMQPGMSPGFYGGVGMGMGGRHSRSYIGFNNYVPVTYEIFRNTLELELYDGKTGKRIWQAKAESDSTGGTNIPGLMPYLVKAAVQGFPGESGQTVRVEFDVTPKAGDNLPSSQLTPPVEQLQTAPK